MFGDFFKQFGFPGIPEAPQMGTGAPNEAATAVPGGAPVAANPVQPVPQPAAPMATGGVPQPGTGPAANPITPPSALGPRTGVL